MKPTSSAAFGMVSDHWIENRQMPVPKINVGQALRLTTNILQQGFVARVIGAIA